MKTRILLIIFILFGLKVYTQVNLRLSLFAKNFGSVMYIRHASDNSFFVVEQNGKIKILHKNGTTNLLPFIDISNKVRNSGEQGPLELMFHSYFKNNGHFITNNICLDSNTEVAPSLH
jgi:arginine decarboxylase-like protein